MLLVRASRRTGISDKIAWIAPTVMAFDIIENIVLDKAMDIAPDNLSEVPLAIGSNACILKWILFASSFLFSFGVLAFCCCDDKQSKKAEDVSRQRNKKS